MGAPLAADAGAPLGGAVAMVVGETASAVGRVAGAVATLPLGVGRILRVPS